MSEVIDFHLPPLIRIKAKHYKMLSDGSIQVESRKFNMKRQNSSFELLRILIAKAFGISGEFTISRRKGRDEVLPLSSEWDLDVAISDTADSYLCLMIQLQPAERALDEWDIIGPADIPLEDDETRCCRRRGSLLGSILNQMEKTVEKFSRALSFERTAERNFPMSHSEFDNFFDSEGRLVRSHEFRLAVYEGAGVDPSIRPTVWMHLLNVFPAGLTTEEREKLLEEKSRQYRKLRGAWQRLMNEGEASEKLKDITNLVHKDALRTDRAQKFYCGPDNNKNVQALYNILTTFAVAHPRVFYCQGMSDLLSPILYVMKDEAKAYIAFCCLMNRLEVNFLPDGRSIKKKFNHLRRMLYFYDRELFIFLRNQGASDLLFTYRWLLLELKREFAYTDALCVLEILWASLPPKPPEKELSLFDEKFATDDKLISSMRTSSSIDNLIWINDHYSCSPAVKNLNTNLSKKMAARARRESELRRMFDKDSSVEDNEEIKFPIHYRKRKYRSYVARKLTILSSSMSRRDSSMLIPKVPREEKQTFCQSWTCGEEVEKYPVKINTALLSAREFLRTQWCYSNTVNEMQLNNWLYRNWWNEYRGKRVHVNSSVTSVLRTRHRSSDSNYSTNSEELLSDCEYAEGAAPDNDSYVRTTCSRSEGYESDAAFSASDDSREEEEEDDDDDDDDDDYWDEDFCTSRLAESMMGKRAEEAPYYFERKKEILPPPHVLGDGNPFLLFLCVAMILQQRDEILRKKMDANDLCMYFDKMVRKHDLNKTLKKARTLFGDYLNMGWRDDYFSDSDEEDYST